MKPRLVIKKMEELKKPVESKEDIGPEISHLQHDKGFEHKRAVAAALSMARRGGVKGLGKKPTKKSEVDLARTLAAADVFPEGALEKIEADLKSVLATASADVRAGIPLAVAMEKAEEELQKMMVRPPSPAGGMAVGSHDRTKANPGNPNAKMTIASAFGSTPAPAPKPAAPAPGPTMKAEDCGPAMQKRIGDLVKSGLRPGEAMEKAREEFGIKPGIKLRGKLEKNYGVAVKPMVKQGTAMPGVTGTPGAMPTSTAGDGGAY